MTYTKALVTGGAGFIGSHICKALLENDIAVTVLDDLSMGKEKNIPAGVEFIKGDLRSTVDVQEALKGATIVFHQAAKVSIRSSLKDYYNDADINLMGTLNLLRCCEGTDVRKIVFASSMAVYADSIEPNPINESYLCEPISPYGIAKLAAEKYLAQFSQTTGTDCVALRYFNTYGVGQTFTPYVGVITIFIRQLLEQNSPRIFGDGQQKRDFVHVSDIVAANILAMNADIRQGIFNVGTGRQTSVNEIAELLRCRIAPDVIPEHVPAHSGELRNSIADITRISDEMDYQPTGELDNRIGEVIDYYKALDA